MLRFNGKKKDMDTYLSAIKRARYTSTPIPLIVILLAIITVFVEPLTAQLKRGDTFFVTVQKKTQEHPYYGMGIEEGFALNGEEGKEIVLQRGVAYTFEMGEIPKDLLFFFALDPRGREEWFVGVSPGNGGETGDVLTFLPPENTPDTLFYASPYKSYAGGRILVVDSITSRVEDQNHNSLREHVLSAHTAPNPFHSSTEISFDLESSSSVAMEIVDVVGRVVYSSEGEWMEAGRRTVTVRGENLPNGVLLYRITALAGERRKIYTGRIVRE